MYSPPKQQHIHIHITVHLSSPSATSLQHTTAHNTDPQHIKAPNMRFTKMKGRLVDTTALQKTSNNATTAPNTAMNVHTMARVNNTHNGTRMHATRGSIQQPRGNN